MKHHRSGPILAALTAAAFLLAAPSGGAVAARQQSSADADPTMRIAGPWRLNADLSSKPPELAPAPSPPASDPNGSGTAGRRAPGGYGGRGGMGGGYGGYGNRAGSRASTNAAQATQMRSLFRELTAAPVGLTIVVSGAMVETTDSDGLIRRFTVDGKKETMEMDAAEVGVTSKWNANILQQEFEIGSQKIDRTIQTSDDNSQLIVNVTPNVPASTTATTAPSTSAARTSGAIRFVYDRN